MDTSTEYNRAIIRGLVSYSQKHDNCLLLSRVPSCLIENSDRKNRIAQWINDWDINAIIIGLLPYKDLLPLSRLNISVVFQNLKCNHNIVSTINEEYVRTGQIAAEFFIRKKFENYAYFGIKGIYWSEERSRGFHNSIRVYRDFNYNEYMIDTNTIDEEPEIIDWLNGLPKPVAIFCCNDKHALVISEYCHIAKINVPQEVSILGVDNDELICNVSNPPLSSIVLNVEQSGYEVGHILHELDQRESIPPFVVSIKPGVIVQRGSTKKHNVKDKEIAKMLDFIDDNFTRDISSKDILRQAFLCRRTAEIRFKKITGTTIYRYLTDLRLDHLCTLMKTTDLPLSECASRSGITDLNYLFHLFKKNMGCSPAAWRNSNMN